MTNVILNIIATGVYQSLTAAAGFPRDAKAVSMQVREAQVDMYYHYINQVAYWTIKAGTVRSLQFGNIQPEELLIMAAAGNTIEVEVSTQLTV